MLDLQKSLKFDRIEIIKPAEHWQTTDYAKFFEDGIAWLTDYLSRFYLVFLPQSSCGQIFGFNINID
nr:hypothetical protein [uncultured Moraxella sp.]